MTRLDKLSADMGKAVTALLLISSLSFSFPIQAIAEGIQQGPSAQVESQENLSEQETTAPRGNTTSSSEASPEASAPSDDEAVADTLVTDSESEPVDTPATEDLESASGESDQTDSPANLMSDDEPTLVDATRIIKNINTSWHFSTNSDILDGWGFPDGRGEGAVDLPHSWEYVHPTMSFIPTMNKKTATYTKTIDVAEYQGKNLFIRFWGSNKNTELLVDDVSVGTHVGGYSAFVFDITDYIQGKQSVTLKVNVTNTDIDSIPINVDYTQWAGIYRDVELVSTADQYISLEDSGSNGTFVNYTLSGNDASFSTRVEVSNKAATETSGEIVSTIADASGTVVSERSLPISLAASTAAQGFVVEQEVGNAHLWNGVNDPYLYTMTVTLKSDSGTTLDQVTQKVGVRTFTISDGKAYLNGNEIEIHGVGYHQDRQGYGNAVSETQMKEDIDTMLDMGVNAVRTAHYPHDRKFYEMADEAGLLVYNEIPYYMIYSKAQSYRDSITSQLTEMIRQGYNSTSTVMWGIQNEVVYRTDFARYGADFAVTKDEIIQFNRELAALARREDSTRFIVQANIDNEGNAATVAQWSSDIDLSGVNLYVGFKSSVSSAGDAGQKQLKDAISAKVDRYTTYFDTTSLMLSEYGAGANINQHTEVDDTFSWDGDSNSSTSKHYEEYQCFVLESYLDVIQSRDDVAASFVWNMFDFSSYRNEGGTTRLNTKGLVTYDHQTKKDAYYLYKANWNTTDKFVHLTSKRFTERNKTAQNIKAYSNCDSVELFVNGVSQGMGTLQQDGVFVWKNVELSRDSANDLRVVAHDGSGTYEDSVSGITVAPSSVVWRRGSDGNWVPYVNGTAVTEGWVLDNGTYYLMVNGQLQTNGWALYESWYYFDANGAMKTGWVKDGSNWYYLDVPNGAMVTGWVYNGGSWYYLSPTGAMATGWLANGGVWYYLSSSGAMQTGWQNVDGTWYYFNASGSMAVGWVLVNGSWCYLGPSGAMQTGWTLVGDSWYYLDTSGAMRTGWVQLGGTWYYLSPTGAMATGWAQVEGSWYYLDASGAMQTGWALVGGSWYYFDGDGAMQTGWLQLDDTWYYLSASGAMVTGRVLVNGTWYVFDRNGAMQ